VFESATRSRYPVMAAVAVLKLFEQSAAVERLERLELASA
jgi:hypothetical protein